jgi:GTP-binding protein EngB required for normal cell division
MFLGRTKAAYVSKKPGKTRQFNVFDVNSASVDSRRASSVVEEASPWSPSGRFRLVDVPGSGYAKVSESYRGEWKVFLREYLATRDNLQAVCHLVDSRVGLQKTDLELFELIGESGFAGDVIIVLTKVDKKSARAAEVLASVRTASPNARVVSTSSKEGIGRAALWRALRGVVLPEAS